MATFSKYRKNCWKAEAIEDIANRIGYNIENEQENKKYYEEKLIEEKAKDEENRSEWQMDNWEETIGKSMEKIKLWEQLLKVIDKEMAF